MPDDRISQMPDSGFTLHPQLAADTFPVGDWPLSRVLLMNDAQFPWLILVPRREALREIYELSLSAQQLLLREASTLGLALMDMFVGDMLNIGELGNLVPPLPLHTIVRHLDDPAWPPPVAGRQL